MYFVALLIMIACNNNKSSEGITVASGNGATTNAPNESQESDATRKKTEELQKLSPYTLDQMTTFLPEELTGTKRSNFSANSVNGAPYAEGSYPINDSSGIEVSIFDCAGDAGVGIYNMQYSNLMNFQMVSEEEYTKTIDFHGNTAIEHSKKDNSNSSFVFLASDRLLVTLEGRNVGVDMLKKAAESLIVK